MNKISINNQLQLSLFKVYAELKSEASRSFLGVFWWVLEPLLYLIAFYITFVMIFQRGGPDFVPLFLCGSVVWKWFDSGVKNGGNSILANSMLIQQVYVPKFIFAFSAVIGSTFRFLPVFVILCIFLLVYGYPITSTWLFIPVLLLVQLMWVFSIALLLSAVIPFVPDIKAVVDNALMLLFFLSGIFFNINEVSEPLKSYLYYNPMAILIDSWRGVLCRGELPALSSIGYLLLVSCAALGAGLYLLKSWDLKYGKLRF
jgi:lipopolysaccharide transport system permease protein